MVQMQLSGGPDRDARKIPYSHGSRAKRRELNSLINKEAKRLRKMKLKALRSEGTSTRT